MAQCKESTCQCRRHRVKSPGQKDPTCRRTTKPLRHNFCAPDPMLGNKRSHCNEEPMHSNGESPCSLQLEKSLSINEEPTQPNTNKMRKKKREWEETSLCTHVWSIMARPDALLQLYSFCYSFFICEIWLFIQA